MKPAPFAYHAPEQVNEVLELLGSEEHEARVIAGVSRSCR
jgi:CO/xanthine dehydrogenase FAD-binding subunit